MDSRSGAPFPPATLSQPHPPDLCLSGAWTARALGKVADAPPALAVPEGTAVMVDASGVVALDSAGAWVLQTLLLRWRGQGGVIILRGLQAPFSKLLERVAQQQAKTASDPVPTQPPQSLLERVGRSTMDALHEAGQQLGFIGETAVVCAGCVAHPSRIRWRPLLFNIRSAGFDALPIVGLLSFLLGVVVAYQGADQLRRYGANIFVADLVGVSMLREFAPLMTAIIVAGRSGSAYAAQIGTMVVTEEIDALRTLGIAPMELLVVPKLVALMIALPLLTVFADVMGVMGGMLMAQVQLGISFNDFLDRFVKAVSLPTLLVGVGKAPAFAAIIAMVGCFQGFHTHGGADSVGRQTTRSVVQAIFLVIVVDALFSIAFSILKL